MSWKRHFRVVPQSKPQVTPSPSSGPPGETSRYSSYLPEVYAGHPQRIQRYYQFDDMDRDPDINAALDTISDFCTQSEEQNERPFFINYFKEGSEAQVKIIEQSLTNWVKLNEFKAKLWYIFRNTIKNGDCFFVRDPETAEWLWIDHYSVMAVKVDDEEGKTPDEYVVKGLDFNKQAKLATQKLDTSNYSNAPIGLHQAAYTRPQGSPGGAASFTMAGGNVDARQARNSMHPHAQDLSVVDAKHVVHLSLNAGMDINWPFGTSILEPIFKTFKQKELLEDAIIIYRVQRAPERRIFYIDVGDMNPTRAKAHLQAIKNEIHQRRIPNRTGGGNSILDAAYNPLGILEDYYFAVTTDGRGSKVETLPGGDSLGEIGDLDYFTRKLARGLRIPSSYLALADENSTPYNDGKLNAAMIQEFRFNKYCMRLQSLLAPVFDREFKTYLRGTGVTIDEDLFEVQFNPPQNFTKYRQIELDMQQVSVYQQVQDNKKLSERFKLERFLNLSEDEILRNEKLWAEENAELIKGATGATPADTNAGADLSSVGLNAPDMGGDFSLPDDMAGGDDMELGGGDAPDMGGDAGGGAPDAPAAPPLAPPPTPGG